MGCSKSNYKREVYSTTILLQEIRIISNKQPHLHLNQLEKQQEKPTVSRRKEIIKGQSRNEWNRNKKNTKDHKTKSCFFEKINNFNKPLARLIKKKRERTK